MRLLIALPFLILLVLFTLSNTTTVHIGLWPTDYGADLPFSIAVLSAMAIAFIAGGLLTWFSALGQSRRARRAEAQVKALEEQLETLRETLRRQEAVLSTPVTASAPLPAIQ
ncbi:Hypothetical protein GbCGDNIH3_2019 [Granulibacter bethesdensis]|uniref:Lipopolysaccharide assembly protein A domain-containing protein n=1 Tax=Granulibacter bethesdensis TaxID=364410 RepID=A0AAN0RF67_9PROT|nr:LapA family protein [Granulibacter bethesdensis]AHJ63908.1 Hypothetical protein GbCGDNIH3_2019 [Granulibacter bethesdensis]